ncbi:MAG: acylneuraminate cytidylyltransferase [Fibrobacteres bacterium]|nr:acylneuraminate cytidylyltransferase [Fibrobacterota bacterium]
MGSLKVLGLIPARGGSKGIPGKNIRPIAGKPLIAWTIEAARASGLDRVILSSDDPEIIATAKSLGLEVPFTRPAELALDATPGIDVVFHAVEHMERVEGYRPDAVMLLQPTSPLRTTAHIDAALELFGNRPEADSLVSVVKAPHNMIPETLMKAAPGGFLESVAAWDERKNLRQAKPAYFARNGAAIYLVRTGCLISKRSLYGDKILPLEMDKSESLDIDDFFDFEMCEYILKKRTAYPDGSGRLPHKD